MAVQCCSRCKKNFYLGDGLDFSGFDRQTLEETSPAAQQKLCSELGARYSVLQELEYFDCIRYFVVGNMHNLYLGTAKHMMKNLWLNEKDFQRIQDMVESMTVPQDIGRIPGKISGFTADQ